MLIRQLKRKMGRGRKTRIRGSLVLKIWEQMRKVEKKKIYMKEKTKSIKK